MNEERFRQLMIELATENPLAVRALLRILTIRFTTEVATLSVTNEERPQLLVNLTFVAAHCRTDAHVKAVVMHEFLHVLLRHTEQRTPVTDEEHLANDAVINAIIHRQCGDEYSSMMESYYAEATGVMRLLRPYRDHEPAAQTHAGKIFENAWAGLYEGKLVVDDIRELALDLQRAQQSEDDCHGTFIGSHDTDEAPLNATITEALDRVLRTMNGGGIWRAPFAGPGAVCAEAVFNAVDTKLESWKRKTIAVLRRHVMPDPKSALRESKPLTYALPVLSPGDRRAFVRSLWSPFLPDASWNTETSRPGGTTSVYLDVSGSMWAEMPHIVALLGTLRRYLRRPLMSFSTEVLPAVIRGGRLECQSTGGTSIACVLEHIASTKPAAAVIVTDGYIEEVKRETVFRAAPCRMHAIVTRDGSTDLLDRAGIPATQLERLP